MSNGLLFHPLHSVQRQPSTAGAAGGDRIPCDLLVWGAAQRAPVTASVRSSAGAQEDCWQHRSAPGLAPGGAFLDASGAAVGRKHAAVVTATGAVYTWGEGRAGKLGLGHDQVRAQERWDYFLIASMANFCGLSPAAA